MPQLGETVTEGTITRWFKQVGEQVAADEPLFEVSTDKVDSEVPAPAAGVVTEILVAEGDTVDVGARLAVISDDASAAASAAAPAAAPPAEPAPPARHPARACARRGGAATSRASRARSGGTAPAPAPAPAVSAPAPAPAVPRRRVRTAGGSSRPRWFAA